MLYNLEQIYTCRSLQNKVNMQDNNYKQSDYLQKKMLSDKCKQLI